MIDGDALAVSITGPPFDARRDRRRCDGGRGRSGDSGGEVMALADIGILGFDASGELMNSRVCRNLARDARGRFSR